MVRIILTILEIIIIIKNNNSNNYDNSYLLAQEAHCSSISLSSRPL